MLFESIARSVLSQNKIEAFPIPATSPTHYISFKHALNVRYRTEDTGDWHFESAFFGDPEISRPIPRAGEGEEINTNPSLGEKGVREMSEVLFAQRVLSSRSPVYVANHYRAIADIAMLHLSENQHPTIATVRAINAWLDTEEQVKMLVSEYLLPLRQQLPATHLSTFDDWFQNVKYA